MSGGFGAPPFRTWLAALATIALLGAIILVPRGADAAAICGVGGIATKTWDGGGGDGNWSTAANWGPDGVPGATARTARPAGRYAYKHVATTNRRGQRFQMIRTVEVS